MRQIKLVRIDTSEVQGEGSFASVKLPKWGKFRVALNLQDAEAMQYATELLDETVADWNWTDDDGEPLPTPKQNPGVIDQLTVAEVQFLVKAITELGLTRGN